jgi:hypothetical protein
MPQEPDFGALADEDAVRIEAIGGLTPVNRHWLARNYSAWLQILRGQGTNQRGRASAPTVVAIESLPGKRRPPASRLNVGQRR